MLRALREKHARSQEGSGAASLPENLLFPENSVQGLVVSKVLQPMEAAMVRMLMGVGQLLNMVRSLIGDESGRSAREDGQQPSFGMNETETERYRTRFSSFFVECCFLERGRAVMDDMASPTSLYVPQCVSHWSRQREWRHWRLVLTYELRRADSLLRRDRAATGFAPLWHCFLRCVWCHSASQSAINCPLRANLSLFPAQLILESLSRSVNLRPNPNPRQCKCSLRAAALCASVALFLAPHMVP